MTWSLNIWGHTLDGDALEQKVRDFIASIEQHGGIQGGTLNDSDRPQVTFTPSASADPVDETAGAAETPDNGSQDASGPQDAPETASEPDAVHPDAPPLASASLEELEGELNRRSAEGQSVTSDGSALQDASAADIEAEISSRGSTQE